MTSDFFLYVIQHGGVGEEGLLPNLRDMLSGTFQPTLIPRIFYTVRYVKSLLKLKVSVCKPGYTSRINRNLSVGEVKITTAHSKLALDRLPACLSQGKYRRVRSEAESRGIVNL